MEQKEIEKLLEGVAEKNGEAISKAVKAEFEAAKAGIVTEKQLTDTLVKAGIKADTIKSLTEAVEKQGEYMRKLTANEQIEKDSLSKIMEKNEKEIVGLADKRTGTFEFKVNKTQVTRASVSGTTMAMRLTDVGQLPYLGIRLADQFRHVQMSPSSNGVLRYYDQASITRGAAMVAEGAQKPESAISWIERTLNVYKIADSIPVTKEAWSDVGFIQGEIERLLEINIALKEDQQLWAGTGTGQELTGIYTTAPTFNPLAYLGFTPLLPNIYDLAVAMQMAIAGNAGGKYAPNKVFLNPADAARLILYKDTQGRYIGNPPYSSSPFTINGMEVVISAQVAVNTLLVGDFRYGTIYDLEETNVTVGWVNDQFIKNAMTILAEKREALLVRTVDSDAFLKVTNITTALNAIRNS